MTGADVRALLLIAAVVLSGIGAATVVAAVSEPRKIDCNLIFPPQVTP